MVVFVSPLTPSYELPVDNYTVRVKPFLAWTLPLKYVNPSWQNVVVVYSMMSETWFSNKLGEDLPHPTNLIWPVWSPAHCRKYPLSMISAVDISGNFSKKWSHLFIRRVLKSCRAVKRHQGKDWRWNIKIAHTYHLRMSLVENGSCSLI